MNIKPIGARVLVEQVEAEKQTVSGIIIPDAAQEKPLQAKVVAVGQEVKEVKTGDIVLYGKYKGTELEYEGKKFIMLDLEDVLATV